MKYSIDKISLKDLKTEYSKAAGSLNPERIEGLKEIFNTIGTTGIPVVNRTTMQVLSNFPSVIVAGGLGQTSIEVIMVQINEDLEIDYFAKLTDPPQDGEGLFERGQLLGAYYREGEGKRLRLEKRKKPDEKPEDFYAPFMNYSRPQIQKLAQIGLQAPDLLKEINVTETVNSAFFLMQKRIEHSKKKESGDDSGNETGDKFFIADPEITARVVSIIEKLQLELKGDTRFNRLIEKGRDKEGVDYALEDENGFGYLKYFPKPEELDEKLLPNQKRKS